jgi:hypothetical protein
MAGKLRGSDPVLTLRPPHCQDQLQMRTPNPRPLASPRITCFGTAFLADAAVDAKLLMRAIPAEAPQFGSTRLDASFLINCGRLLTDKQATLETPSTYVKRVAGSDFRSPKGAVIYECSTVLRGLLAALTPDRAAEVAKNWYGEHGQPNTKGRTQLRVAILENIAALAKQARDKPVTLMLRVDYRKRI